MATTQYSRIRDPVDTDSDTSSLHPGDAYEASPPDGTTKPHPSSSSLTPYTLRLTLIASISGLLFGYDTGIISSTLLYLSPNPSLVNPPPSLTPGRLLTPFEKSLITSATSLTALLASLCIGPILDSWGRKFAIYISAFFFVFGAAFQGTSFNVWSMVVGRMVVGLGVGLGSGVVPVWVGEVCRKEERGRLVVGLVGGITAGQVVSYLVGLLSGIGWRWRVCVGVGALPALIQAVLMRSLAESPRWLVEQGRTSEARDVLAKVYDPSEVDGVLVGIQRVVTRVGQGVSIRQRWAMLWGDRESRKMLGVACLAQGLQQLCGFNTLMYFSPTVFMMVGFENPTATALCIAGTNMIFTIVAFSLIDRIGRRRILLGSLPFMTLGLLGAAFAISNLPIDYAADLGSPYDRPTSIIYPAIMVLSLITYVAFYALGIGNVPWQQSELFPLETRALGSGVATAVNWAANTIVGITFLPLVVSLGAEATFTGYAVICALGWVACWRWFPERMGVGLESIGGEDED